MPALPPSFSSIRPGVVIAATLDTKSDEIMFVRDQLARHGLAAIIIDCGVLGEATLEAAIDNETVARAARMSLAELRSRRDRAIAIPTMITGLEAILAELLAGGKVLGYLGVGGGTNAALAGAAFRQLPYGLPKMLVSTVAAGDTRPFIGIKDVMLMHSVVDILGLNDFLRGTLSSACAAMAAMVAEAGRSRARPRVASSTAAITAFGSTTTAATRAWHRLSARGIEVLSFHARGIGGQAMEELIRAGEIGAVLDLTITEIADEIVGGIFSAGPDRLSAAAEAGVPQVVLPGSIDMVNFGARESIPERFKDRRFASHTPLSTLMRTTASENEAIARFVADKLNAARGQVSVVLPLRGFSAYDIAGGPFFDPAADAAFCETLAARLHPRIRLERIDAHINDAICADRAASLLVDMITTSQHGEGL